MSMTSIVLRDMREDEYDGYAEEQIRDYVGSLTGVVPAEAALEKARRDRARFLPDGLATERHRLLAAENAAGQVVGYAWFGLDDPRTNSSELAWLYDIRVDPAHRGAGYGAAILAAVEALARDAGAQRLGLNVFGQNTTAIALYERSGYRVTNQEMAKRLH
jgi:ribosomal protein S18 acetylase RimI-like enzyme